jgi:hypothetical protein
MDRKQPCPGIPLIDWTKRSRRHSHWARTLGLCRSAAGHTAASVRSGRDPKPIVVRETQPTPTKLTP